MHDRQNLAHQRFADDGRDRARVVENELVVALPQQRVDRNRDRANLDGAEEARVEGAPIVHEQDDALFGGETEGLQRVPGAIHERVQLAVRHRTVRGHERRATAVPLAHLARDEIVGDVERLGDDRRHRGWQAGHCY